MTFPTQIHFLIALSKGLVRKYIWAGNVVSGYYILSIVLPCYHRHLRLIYPKSLLIEPKDLALLDRCHGICGKLPIPGVFPPYHAHRYNTSLVTISWKISSPNLISFNFNLLDINLFWDLSWQVRVNFTCLNWKFTCPHFWLVLIGSIFCSYKWFSIKENSNFTCPVGQVGWEI